MTSTLEFNKKISQDGSTIYAASSAGSDTYAITLVPAITSYTTGLVVNFEADVANTGAATLNINSVGAITIKKNYNQDLADGDIAAGQIVTVVYDGTNFQMQTQLGQAAGGGKLLQVDSTAKTDTFSTTSSSFVAITGLATSGLSPSSSSNDILVLANIVCSGSNRPRVALYRQINSGGWSAIAIGDAAGSRIRATSIPAANGGVGGSVGISYLDSPATTNLVEYAIYMSVDLNVTHVNRDGTDANSNVYSRGISTITAMEIDGT